MTKKATPKTTKKSELTGAEKVRWDLSDLFSGISDPEIENVLKTTQKNAKSFQDTYKGKMKSLTAKELNTAYKSLEKLLSPFYKVSQYVSLIFSTETTDDNVKALDARVDDLSAKIQNELLFFDLELGKVSAKKLDQLIIDPALKTYAYNLESTKKNAKYYLTEAEEKIINLKDVTGVDAFQKLYEELTTSFEFEFELDGEVKTMTGSELRALRMHPDKDVRRRAMKTFYKCYEDNAITLTHIFNQILKDKSTEKNLRGYKSAINMRNESYDLPDKAVENLHAITTKSYKLVSKYYKIKKNLIDLPDMTLADIYAPLPQSTKKFSFNEAKELVLEAFAAFDDEFYTFAKEMFDENRVDAPVAKNKRGGAFCSCSTPDVKPYVLLNYLGKPRDIATIAHEFGHAIHDRYAAKQTLFNYHPILPLAETASIFCEMILTDLLLSKETDTLTKQTLLTGIIEDMIATSHRQNMFSRFEIATHDKADKGLLSTKDLCELYQKELKLMFGDAVKYTDEYKWEWATIPHIFAYPFYVYSYNFGNLLVMALYQQYKEEGKAFIPKFKKLLSMGGSASPEEIAKIVGADILNPKFWGKSITLIEGFVKDLEVLTKT